MQMKAGLQPFVPAANQQNAQMCSFVDGTKSIVWRDLTTVLLFLIVSLLICMEMGLFKNKYLASLISKRQFEYVLFFSVSFLQQKTFTFIARKLPQSPHFA